MPGGPATAATAAAARVAPVALPERSNKNLVLAAMIFAVAMTFIDMTIVSIAAPELQQDLELSATGLQWVINGYLLALSAMFALGGRLADVVGHRTMVVTGVIVFAVSSAMCGATPRAPSPRPGSSSSASWRGSAPPSCSRPRSRS